MMKTLIKAMTVLWLALLLPASPAFAQDRTAFGQEELDQMLAPIALHPDSLLSQILMASTYPLEVVQAARWSRANPNLKGQHAVNAVEGMAWDPSVKSLTAFPEVLSMMDEKLDWTERLGEAFLAQQAQVMDTIQGLRRRAAAAGNLEPGEHMGITRRDEHIIIEPPDPQVVHVPYYNPTVVYGPWWWPAYPPVYWGPPLGYYGGAGGWGPDFLWGPGIIISSGFFFGAFDWRNRHVNLVHFRHHRAFFARRGIVWTRPGPAVWRHDVFHRRGVAFRNPALRQEFSRSSASGFSARRDLPGQVTAPVARPPEGERSPSFRARPDRRSESREESGRRDVRSPATRSAATPVARPPVDAVSNLNGNTRRAQPPAESGRSPRTAAPHIEREPASGHRSVPAHRASTSNNNPAPRAENGNRGGGHGARDQGERARR